MYHDPECISSPKNIPYSIPIGVFFGNGRSIRKQRNKKGYKNYLRGIPYKLWIKKDMDIEDMLEKYDLFKRVKKDLSVQLYKEISDGDEEKEMKNETETELDLMYDSLGSDYTNDLELNSFNSLKVRLIEWSYKLQANDVIVVDVSGILEYREMSNAQVYHSHVAYFSDTCEEDSYDI